MSLLGRIKRLVHDDRFELPDGGEQFGRRGESRFQEELRRRYPYVITNAIVTHPKDADGFLEVDALIYEAGVLFCVEIKSQRGRIFLDPKDKQYKKERHGHLKPCKPFSQPKRFSDQLAHVNSSFRQVKRVPVVVFNDDPELDVSAIRSWERGIILASEFPDFIAYHLQKQASKNATKTSVVAEVKPTMKPTWGEWIRLAFSSLSTSLFGWPLPVSPPSPQTTVELTATVGTSATNQSSDPQVLEALRQLPRMDRLVMVDDDTTFSGVLVASDFELVGQHGRIEKVPLTEVQHIRIERRPRWESGDLVYVRAYDGTERQYRNMEGRITLKVGVDKVIPYALRSISKIEVGSAALPRVQVSPSGQSIAR